MNYSDLEEQNIQLNGQIEEIGSELSDIDQQMKVYDQDILLLQEKLNEYENIIQNLKSKVSLD